MIQGNTKNKMIPKDHGDSEFAREIPQGRDRKNESGQRWHSKCKI